MIGTYQEPMVAPSPREAKEELALRRARRSFSSFFRLFPPARPYLFGRHTEIILREIDRAHERMQRGLCTYLVISVPFRHGKSDIVSRSFPSWYLCRNPDHEVMLVSYGADLAQQMSDDAREKFALVAPRLAGLKINPKKNRADLWRVDGHRGRVSAFGLDGSATGKGAHALLIDDWIKNREAAESDTYRDKMWDGFGTNFMTRLAPVHMVVALANRWHVDDPTGRILQRNDPNDKKHYDPDFPKFRHVKIPAIGEDGTPLFAERMGNQWYKTMRATLGPRFYSAMFQQEPIAAGGNRFKTDRVRIIDRSQLPAGLRFNRGWDLASSAKERNKPDPDYTWGTKSAFDSETLWIDDAKWGQWEAPERNRVIRSTVQSDGPGVECRIEVVAGYKDTYTSFARELEGVAKVSKVGTEGGDKTARAACLEPLFDAGKVVLVRGPWNDAWLKHFSEFPGGKHDDGVDSLVTASGKEIRGNFDRVMNMNFSQFGRRI
jgi:predicted phage terminase large subunit-like protein